MTICSLYNKMSLQEKLASSIRFEEFIPQEATVEELAQNIIDCYDVELEDSEQEYFSVKNNRIDDIIEFVKASGGFAIFDFVV